MGKNRPQIWLLVLAFLVLGCAFITDLFQTPTDEVSEDTAVSEPTNTPQPKPTDKPPEPELPTEIKIRLHITTTSRSTAVTLAEGATPEDWEIVSSSSEALDAGFAQGWYQIIQPEDRAEAGQTVEMVVDVTLKPDSLEDTLVFWVDRDPLGSTTVEIYNFSCGEPHLAVTFTWDGFYEGGPNIEEFHFSAAEILDC